MTRKRWPSASRVCPTAGAAVEEPLRASCALMTATNRASATSAVPIRASFEERELEDPPELVVGPLERRRDSSGRRRTSARCVRSRRATAARRPAGCARSVEQLEAAVARPGVVRPVHHGPLDIERAVLPRLRGAGPERVVEQRRDDHQHQQREADAEQADEGEELAAQQHLHGEHEIVIEHGGSPVARGAVVSSPAGRRTAARCARSASAFC